MILHASIAADDPRKTAETLAELIGGRALPIPGDGGAWMAVACDANGTAVEVLRRGREYHRRADAHCQMAWGPEQRHGATHLMIETPHDEETVIALAARRGCYAHRTRHAVFDVLEFWIDDCQLLDVMTPPMAATYKALTSQVFKPLADVEARA